MLSIVTMIIWSLMGYLSGYSDACEETRQGLVRIIVYILMAIGIVIIFLNLKKGEFI